MAAGSESWMDVMREAVRWGVVSVASRQQQVVEHGVSHAVPTAAVSDCLGITGYPGCSGMQHQQEGCRSRVSGNAQLPCQLSVA